MQFLKLKHKLARLILLAISKATFYILHFSKSKNQKCMRRTLVTMINFFYFCTTINFFSLKRIF